jgi:hypothetical protein
MMRWAGHVALMGAMINAFKMLVGDHEGRRQLGRPRRRWEGNIRMNRNRVVSCGPDSYGSA